MRPLPTKEHLHELLAYDAETGELTWRNRKRHWFLTDRSHAVWNGKFAGKPALNTPKECGHLQGYLLSVMRKSHRVIWKMAYGTEPDCIDHIDGDPSNNRLANLREVTQSGNMKNQKLRIDNGTGTPGIHFDKNRGLYMAYVNSEGKRKYLGRYATLERARAVREGANRDYEFHENHGRVVV